MFVTPHYYSAAKRGSRHFLAAIGKVLVLTRTKLTAIPKKALRGLGFTRRLAKLESIHIAGRDNAARSTEREPTKATIEVSGSVDPQVPQTIAHLSACSSLLHLADTKDLPLLSALFKPTYTSCVKALALSLAPLNLLLAYLLTWDLLHRATKALSSLRGSSRSRTRLAPWHARSLNAL